MGHTKQLHIQNRLVPDPSMTDAEFLHQKSKEMERANANRTKPNLDIGKVWTQENAMGRMGALCFIRPPRRQPHHERTAEWFKSSYEARYGGSGGAMDPSRVQVDTSPIAHDSGMAAKIDRTSELHRVMKALTKPQLNRLVATIVLGISCADQSPTMPSGQPNPRHVGNCTDETLDVLDFVAELLGHKTRTRAA